MRVFEILLRKLFLTLFLLASFGVLVNCDPGESTSSQAEAKGDEVLPPEETEEEDDDYDVDLFDWGTDDPFSTPVIDDYTDLYNDETTYPQVTVVSSSGTATYASCSSSTLLPPSNPCTEEGGTCTVTVASCSDTGCDPAQETVTLDMGEGYVANPNDTSSSEYLLDLYYYTEGEKLRVVQEIQQLAQEFQNANPDANAFTAEEQIQVQKIYGTAAAYPCSVVSDITTMGTLIVAEANPNDTLEPYDANFFPIDLEAQCEDPVIEGEDNEDGNPYLRYGHVVYLQNQKGFDEDPKSFLTINTEGDNDDCNNGNFCVTTSTDDVTVDERTSFDPKKLWQIVPGEGKEDTFARGDVVKDGHYIRLKSLYYDETLVEAQSIAGLIASETLYDSELGYTWLDVNGKGCEDTQYEDENHGGRDCLSLSSEKSREAYSSSFKIHRGYSYEDKLKVSVEAGKEGDEIKYQDRLYLQSVYDPETEGENLSTNHFLDVQGGSCFSEDELCVSSGYFDPSLRGNHLANFGITWGNPLTDDFTDTKFRSSEWLMKSPCFPVSEDLATDGDLAMMWGTVAIAGAVMVGLIVNEAVKDIKKKNKAKTDAKKPTLIKEFDNRWDRFANGSSSGTKDLSTFIAELEADGVKPGKIRDLMQAKMEAVEGTTTASGFDKGSALSTAYQAKFGVPLQSEAEMVKRLNLVKAEYKAATGKNYDVIGAFNRFKTSSEAKTLGVRSNNASYLDLKRTDTKNAFRQFQINEMGKNKGVNVKLLTGDQETEALTSFNLYFEPLLQEFLSILSIQEEAGLFTPSF